VALLIPIFVLVAVAILGGRTLANAEVSAASPTQQPTTSQTSDNIVEAEAITTGATLGAGAIGAFAVWLSKMRAETRRRRYDQHTARQSLIVEYETSVFDYADAVAKEFDAVTDATRMNAEIRTNAAAAHTMRHVTKVLDNDLVALNRHLIDMRDAWRRCTSVSERAAILGGTFKETLGKILDHIQTIYTQEEAAKDRRAA
jgi:hypothetical protein